MKIILSPRAEKNLRKLPKFDSLAIAEKIRKLHQFDISKTEKLLGFPDVYRVRVGNYRIVYKRTKNTLYIILIHHCRDVYRPVKDLLS